jgi:hypothetical protein
VPAPAPAQEITILTNITENSTPVASDNESEPEEENGEKKSIKITL